MDDKLRYVPGPDAARALGEALARDEAMAKSIEPGAHIPFARQLVAYALGETPGTPRRMRLERERHDLRKAVGAAVVEGYRREFNRDPTYDELTAGVEHVVKSLGGESEHSAGPTPTAVTRRRRDLDQPARSNPQGRSRWDFEPEAGKVVRFKLGDEVHHGRITDWGGHGVRVATRRGPAVIAWDDLTPVTEDELREHRERKIREEDEDQERRGVELTRFSTLDIVPGSHKVTCVDPETDEQVEGRAVSVSHAYPAHVVVHSIEHRDGKARRKLSVHPVSHVVSIEEPGG